MVEPTAGNDVGARRLLLGGLRAHRRDTLIGTVLGTAHQLSEVLVAVVIGLVVDRAIVTGDAAAMMRWTFVFVALFVALTGGAALGYYRLERASQRFGHDVRRMIVDRVIDDHGIADVRRTGEILSLATSDADQVGGVVSTLAGAVFVVSTTLLSAAYLFRAAWQLGVVLVVGVPVVFVTMRWFAAPLRERSSREQESVADATAVATDLVRGLRVLKGLGAEDAGSASYRRVSQLARLTRLRSARFAALFSGVEGVINAAFVLAIAAVGARLAASGSITIGQLVGAIGLAPFAAGSLSSVLGVAGEFAACDASAGRVATFLSSPSAAAQHPQTDERDRSGRLELRNVSAGALTGLDIAVTAGEWMGLVAGDERAARSLIELLARRSDPTRGSIHFDGVALGQWSPSDLRSTILVAEQEHRLFGGTVADTLSLHGIRPAPPAGVLAATGADEVVSSLRNGIDSEIGEDGRRLSGGQRQRLVLARAVAANAPVLVLHDPTSSVDPATEASIARGVRALRANHTTILVTTSPALLAVCDRVVVLADGRAARIGTHAELIASDDDYRAAVLS